jgi:hypothetical protein
VKPRAALRVNAAGETLGRHGLERLVLAKGSALLQFPINLPLIASDS